MFYIVWQKGCVYMAMHEEIERKYLIAYPDVEMLEGLQGCETWKLCQTYLTAIR